MVPQGVTAAQHIAHWAADYRVAETSRAVCETSKLLILDAVGVALIALDDRVGLAVRRLTDQLGSGEATVIGKSTGVSPVDAAYSNGTLIHALDYDDMSFGGHATGCVLPAVLALAEANESSGDEILSAYIAGMETFGRLALDAVPAYRLHEIGWHPTPIFGALGSAIAAARVLRLTSDEMCHALGLAASTSSGLVSNFGTMAKATYSGQAARAGVLAALEAQAGFTANPAILEAPQGFARAYSRQEGNWDALRDGLANPLRLTFKPPTIKQYPSCGGSHWVVQTLLQMKDRLGLTVDNVRLIEVHVEPELLVVLSFDQPADEYEAKFSLPFHVISALVSGKPSVGAYEDATVRNLHGLMTDKVKVFGDLVAHGKGDGSRPPVQSRIQITMVDGTTYDAVPEVLHGSPDDPMSKDEVVEKFLENATPALGARQAERLGQAILAVDEDTAGFWAAWKGLRMTDREATYL